MKKVILLSLFTSILSVEIFAESSYEKYRDNFCNSKRKSIDKVVLNCSKLETTPQINGSGSIEEVLNYTVEQDFKSICSGGRSKKIEDLDIKGYVKNGEFLPFPPDKCACKLDLGLPSVKRLYCQMGDQGIDNLRAEYQNFIALSELQRDYNDHLNDEKPKDEKNSCHTTRAKDGIKKILTSYDFQKENQVMNETLQSLLNNPSDPMLYYARNFCNTLNTKQEEILKKYSITDIKKQHTIPFSTTSKRRTAEMLEVLSCLSYSDARREEVWTEAPKKSLASSKRAMDLTFLVRTTQSLDISIIEIASPGISLTETDLTAENIEKLEEEYTIDIEEEDSLFVINRKIAIAANKKQYHFDLKKTSKLSSELSSLVDQLATVKNPQQRKKIFSRLHQIKKELRQVARTVPQRDNISSIQDIEKKYPEEARQYYAEIENDYKTTPQKNEWNKARDVSNTSFKIPTGVNNKKSSKNNEYVPFYNKETNAVRTNIAPAPAKSKAEIAKEQEQAAIQKKQNIAQAFSSGSRGPASVAQSNSRSRSNSSKSSASAPSLKSYNIPTKDKEPEVINNSDKPNIKVVFIADQKVMKLFKLEDKVYELKEEITKEDFVENFESFPELVKEQGRSFFNIFDSRKLKIQ